jgi:predicted ATPase
MQLALGASLMAVQGYAHPEVRAAYERAEGLCEAIGDPDQLANALVGLASFLVSAGELQRAIGLCEGLLELGARTGDDAPKLGGHAVLGLAQFWQGNPDGQAHSELAISIYDPARHHRLAYRYGTDLDVLALATRGGTAAWIRGQPERATMWVEEAIALARRLDHPVSLAFALTWGAAAFLDVGQGDRALVLGEEAADLGDRHGLPLWSGCGRFHRGLSLVHAQGSREALQDAVEGLRIAVGTGNQASAPDFLGRLASAQRMVGLREDACRTLSLAMAVADQTGQQYWTAELRRLEGELHLEVEGDAARAAACFEQAIETARGQQAKSLELRAAMSLARLWQPQGRRGEARALLAPIYAWFTEGFGTPDLTEAKALLAELG